MFGRFNTLIKCCVGLVLIIIVFSWLALQRSRSLVEKERLMPSYPQSASLFSEDKLSPSKQQSSIRFSTEGAAVCRQTSASTAAVDRKQCTAILGRRMTKRRLKKLKPFKVTRQPWTLDDYVTCASDCDRFRSELGYWTSTDNISKEELEFPIAFRWKKLNYVHYKFE
jgi:hypothetical protein